MHLCKQTCQRLVPMNASTSQPCGGIVPGPMHPPQVSDEVIGKSNFRADAGMPRVFMDMASQIARQPSLDVKNFDSFAMHARERKHPASVGGAAACLQASHVITALWRSPNNGSVQGGSKDALRTEK